MLDLIPRFYDTTRGAILIDGMDVRRIRRDSLMRQIAIVSQHPFLFNRPIAENIRYGKPDATDEEVVAAAKAANIHDFIAGLPDGYQTNAGEMGGRFSGGQRQCLTIARALLKDAPILILDEATSSLDAESEMLVQAALNNLMRDRTTLVIAHRLSTVRHADRIIVLKDGRIAEQGTHEELLETGGEYHRLYRLQFAATEEDDGEPNGPDGPQQTPENPAGRPQQ
jgi:ABC-type multidrug transport system fused ATPase/permease subunit